MLDQVLRVECCLSTSPLFIPEAKCRLCRTVTEHVCDAFRVFGPRYEDAVDLR